MSIVVVVAAFAALAVLAAVIWGWIGAVVVALMGVSCWYGWQVGHLRGRQAGVQWYANMLREEGSY